MADFLQNATYQDIMEREIELEYIYATIIPYVKLFYLQISSSTISGLELERLHMLSLQTIFMSLQNMLGRENDIKILLSEGLEDFEDFITCSPSYVPESLKPQADCEIRDATPTSQTGQPGESQAGQDVLWFRECYE